MASARVYRWGDWDRANRIFNGLGFKMKAVLESSAKAEAEATARRIKRNIFAKAYPHADLAEATKKRKEKLGKDPRVLIEDGEYVRAIEAISLGRGDWAVGVKDEKLGKLAATHEWGGVTPKGSRIPARPIYRLELARIRTGVLRGIKAGMEDLLSGRISTSRNQRLGMPEDSGEGMDDGGEE